jgi:osmotically-inducible protein OsmY
LSGVKGVLNNIVVSPDVEATDVQDEIEPAFKRSAEVDARRISVIAKDGTVILTGHLRS